MSGLRREEDPMTIQPIDHEPGGGSERNMRISLYRVVRPSNLIATLRPGVPVPLFVAGNSGCPACRAKDPEAARRLLETEREQIRTEYRSWRLQHAFAADRSWSRAEFSQG